MASRLWLLVVAQLLLLAAAAPGDDYFYDEEVEEVASTHVPRFTTEPLQLNAMPGDTVTLPCYMDKAAGVIIWRSGSKVFFTGSFTNSKDTRVKLSQSGPKGNSLVITDVRPQDSGTYECLISSSPPVSLHHVVNIKYAPVVTTDPAQGVLVIRQGQPVRLSCTADANPPATITWTRKGGVLPNGEQKLEGETLEVAAVDRSHMGSYTCTVDNGVGKAVVKDFRLEVNFAPEIELMTNTVHTGAGFEAQLMCKVRGQPLPKVRWSRTGGATLDDQHHVERHEGDDYYINIDKVMDSDMGLYSCRAESSLGTAAAAIEVTGKPTPVVVSSDPNGQEKNSFTLNWSVESYSPVKEYKVIYKNTQVNGTNPEVQQQWEQVIVAAPRTDGANSVLYKYTYALRDLQPASVYEGVVTARNKYGWSREPTEPFRFSTLGAQALGSKDPNGASTLRGGLLSSLAALCALLVVL
ncbi:protein amalgam-like isoform X2 [Pollicipes pollicipes]|uniref:protein amalgam-like isoform X2 n=1 Tax=Pollicipes pollicipes TaxID=41117 RepID=UPI0018852D97|nr:protein amalgam-like isoform X2 [Pollicipes pollicipes]